VSTALQAGVKIGWLENQTGVNYGKWMPPTDGGSGLPHFSSLAPGLFTPSALENCPFESTEEGTICATIWIPTRSGVRKGVLEPPRVLPHRILNPSIGPLGAVRAAWSGRFSFDTTALRGRSGLSWGTTGHDGHVVAPWPIPESERQRTGSTIRRRRNHAHARWAFRTVVPLSCPARVLP